jgi:Na+-transporting NADH:ubiquinone oxidoreductase subunit C
MLDNIKAIIFTLVLCIVCSLLLTTAATKLGPMQEKNKKIYRQQNILKAAGYIDANSKYSDEEIINLYETKIIPVKSDNSLDFYLTYSKDDKISGYIIPLESSGLWGKIHGYIALGNDGKTVSGVSIYDHQETPGLGGEIDKKAFLSDFENKKIVDENGKFTGIKIAKGKAENSVSDEKMPHYVDGISGATLTGNYLSSGLVSTLEKYEPVSEKFRQGNPEFIKKEE